MPATMTSPFQTLRFSLLATAAVAALAAAPAQAEGVDWLLGVKPVYDEMSPALGVGRIGLGLAPQSAPAGLFPYPDAGPVGFSMAPALAYRARPNLALEAGLDVTYRMLREPGLVAPDATSPEMGGVGLSLGLRYDYDARTQFGVAYRSELRGDPYASRYFIPRTGTLDTARNTAPQALSANIQRQVGSRWSLLGSLGWQQAEPLALRSDAWTAGVGAQYRLHEDLGVGMALEYSTANGADAARRNIARDVPASDGGSYFFGLDLNWRF